MTPHLRERTAGHDRGGACSRALLRPAARRGVAVAALAALTAACAPEPGDENLKASFAAQIEGIASVGGLERSGDELTFTQSREGDTAVAWRVTIDSVSARAAARRSRPGAGEASFRRGTPTGS